MGTKYIVNCIFFHFLPILNEIEHLNLIHLKETRGLRNGTNSFNNFWYTNMPYHTKFFTPNFQTQHIYCYVTFLNFLQTHKKLNQS